MVVGLHRGIIVQHLPHLFLRETGHFVEERFQGIVGPDVETAGQVIHRDRTDTGHEESLDGLVGPILDHIVKLADVPLTMRLLAILVEAVRLGQNLVGEVVVFVDQEVEGEAQGLTFRADTIQQIHSLGFP